ncbi:unnamed protein product [Lampetra planeri]
MAVRSWWSDLSVMPLDVRGRTRATLNGSACVRPSPAGVGNPLKPIRDRDWGLELFPMNEEFPVSASHKLALIKSLPFVHTARRYYRLDGLVRSSDWPRWGRRLPWGCAEKTIELDCLEEVKVVTSFWDSAEFSWLSGLDSSSSPSPLQAGKTRLTVQPAASEAPAGSQGRGLDERTTVRCERAAGATYRPGSELRQRINRHPTNSPRRQRSD